MSSYPSGIVPRTFPIGGRRRVCDTLERQVWPPHARHKVTSFRAALTSCHFHAFSLKACAPEGLNGAVFRPLFLADTSSEQAPGIACLTFRLTAAPARALECHPECSVSAEREGIFEILVKKEGMTSWILRLSWLYFLLLYFYL